MSEGALSTGTAQAFPRMIEKNQEMGRKCRNQDENILPAPQGRHWRPGAGIIQMQASQGLRKTHQREYPRGGVTRLRDSTSPSLFVFFGA